MAKSSLTLSPEALAALEWFLQGTIQHRPQNYYQRLLILTLAELWEKKVFPKTAIYNRETKLKLDERQSLALGIAAMSYDTSTAPLNYQVELAIIFDRLPKLPYEYTRLTPPKLQP